MRNHKPYTKDIAPPISPTAARKLASNWKEGTLVRAVFDTLGALDDQDVLASYNRRKR